MPYPFKRRLLQQLFRAFRHYEVRHHELSYLFWECTLKCNLNCLHCGSDCSHNSAIPDMPASHFFSALDTIKAEKDSIIVVMTGGEPLLRPDLATCGTELRKKGFRWGIVSNGLGYNADMHNKLLNAGMGALTFSLDGLEENHNWLRNHPLAFNKVDEAISLVVKSPRINFDVVTCVNKRNITELPDIYKYLSEKGVKAWRLFTIAPIGRAATNKQLHLSSLQMKQLFEFVALTRSYKKMDVKFSCEGYTGPFENKVRKGFFFCRAGINIASVLADGAICACPNINRCFAQGSIYTDNFFEVWQNRFSDFRNRKWARKGICKTCSEFKFCNGNGLHLHRNKETGVMVCHYRMIMQSKI